MPALLSHDYRERCLWQDQVDPPATTQAPPPPSADVVVVGAGLCGLSAADTAARAGRSVVVLDKEALGWGASSRNGGMVIPELKAGPATLTRKYGELGTAMYAEVQHGFDHIEAMISGDDGHGGLECDYTRAGELWLAHSVGAVAHLQAEAREHADCGEPVRYIARADLRHEIGSDAFAGAVLYERTGALHPAKYHAGLARRAITSGAALHDHTAVTAVSQDGAGHRVTTTRGTIAAKEVIIATNAYADPSVPWLAKRVLPMTSFIIATAPLGPATASSVSPKGRMMVDTKHLLFYWRLTPDGRLAFGGRPGLGPVELPTARDYLYDEMLRIHPQLAGVTVEYAWGGNVAMTLDRMPHAGRVDSAWYATGCNGSGVLLNTWLGHRLGQTVTGQGPAPSFARLRHRRIPLSSLTTSYLPLLGRWFSWQDRR